MRAETQARVEAFRRALELVAKERAGEPVPSPIALNNLRVKGIFSSLFIRQKDKMRSRCHERRRFQ